MLFCLPSLQNPSNALFSTTSMQLTRTFMNIIPTLKKHLSFYKKNKHSESHHSFDDAYHLQIRKIFEEAMISSHGDVDLGYSDDGHCYDSEYVHGRFLAFVNRYNLAIGVNKFYKKRWGYNLGHSSAIYIEYYTIIKEVLVKISLRDPPSNPDIERIRGIASLILEEGDLWPHSKIYNLTDEVRNLAIKNGLLSNTNTSLRLPSLS